MDKLQRIISIFSFIAISLFATNSFAEHTQCPPPSDIHHECIVDVHGNYECNWVTTYVGWEGDSDYNTKSTVTIVSFIRAIWYKHYNQVNCIYQDSTGKNMRLIPTWFGQESQPKGGNWQQVPTVSPEPFLTCQGSVENCPFIYK